MIINFECWTTRGPLSPPYLQLSISPSQLRRIIAHIIAIEPIGVWDKHVDILSFYIKAVGDEICPEIRPQTWRLPIWTDPLFSVQCGQHLKLSGPWHKRQLELTTGIGRTRMYAEFSSNAVSDETCLPEHYPFHQVSGETTSHFLALSRLRALLVLVVQETESLRWSFTYGKHRDSLVLFIRQVRAGIRTDIFWSSRITWSSLKSVSVELNHNLELRSKEVSLISSFFLNPFQSRSLCLLFQYGNLF